MPRPKASSGTDTVHLREQFLKEVGTQTPFYRLFDHLQDIAFFAKDRQCRIVGASRMFFERFGFQSETEILGKDDFELFPARLAESFRLDDQAVLDSGEPRLNLVELFFNRQGVPDWYVTNNLPIRNTAGKVIGLMGTTQSYAARKEVLRPYLNLDRAVEYIRKNLSTRLSVETLAQEVHLSPRQLHRKFVEAFGMGPQAFALKLRIQAACEALQNTDGLIADIAASLGFCDQSAFTQAFHKHIGITPKQYQMQFQLRRF